MKQTYNKNCSSNFLIPDTIAFSIIMPVYNSETYLEECLISLQQQVFSNFEVLLIDDGSIDKSADICKYFVSQDKRFKYFQIAHGGISIARNFGLEKASGKYIFFMDSDDTINDMFFQVIFENFEKNQSDIVFISTDVLNWQMPIDSLAVVAPWGCLYRKSFLDKHKEIRFSEKLEISEDSVFSFKILPLTNRKSLEKAAMYNYRRHSAMASRTTSLDVFYYGIIDVIKDIREFLDKNDLKEKMAWSVGSLLSFDFFIHKFYKIGLSHFIYKMKVYKLLKSIYRENVEPYITRKQLKDLGYLFNRFVNSSNYFSYEIKNCILSNKLCHCIFIWLRKRKG